MVSPGFRKGGIAVSQVGIRMYVTIPEIGVQVMFTGLIFSVEVPFSKFANNTEGQCGEPPSPLHRLRGRQPRPWSLNAADGVPWEDAPRWGVPGRGRVLGSIQPP